MGTELDILVIDNYLLIKQEQDSVNIKITIKDMSSIKLNDF